MSVEIGDDAPAIDFGKMSRSGIDITDAISEGIINQNRYLPGRSGQSLGFHDRADKRLYRDVNLSNCVGLVQGIQLRTIWKIALFLECEFFMNILSKIYFK